MDESNLFLNRVSGMIPFTMLDYPNKLSAILFYAGCNIRCPYCYNPHIVKNEVGYLDNNEILNFLKKRRKLLNGIVFSGGECTIHGDNLIKDIEFVKSLGYLVKLDTNGTNIETILHLKWEKLVDYVALDFKHPSDIKKFDIKDKKYINNIKTLVQSGIATEVRTTFHPDLITENEINEIIKLLKEWNYNGTYYIQNYFHNEKTLGNVDNNPRQIDKNLIIKDLIKVEIRNDKDDIQ